ncbi:hypothetical protein JXA12_00810 [Candidatus Woesearchaeota archaeon]|nr:hypothetical protein [Candidatus Woesearchaeota archaeon]
MTNPFDTDDESELERIRNSQDKKPKMGILNQKKVSKWEMDELFGEEDYYEEF